jgi:general secretion pathway protein F
MPALRFRYEAIDRAGRAAAGELTAANEREGQRWLESQGLVPVRLTPAVEKRGRRTLFARGPSAKERLLTLRELALLLRAGLALVDAVKAIAENAAHESLRTAFAAIGQRLRGGTSFTAAARAALPGFPAYVFQLTEAGETTGRLAASLEDAVAQMEYDQKLADEIRNALLYPSILLTAGLAAVLFIFIVVVPRFASMLSTAGAEVPWISRAVLSTGLFFNEYRWFVILAALGGGWALVRLWRQEALRLRLWQRAGDLPMIGPWLRESELARWASLLATMLSNGVDMVRALGLARESVRLDFYRTKFETATKAVRGGRPLSAALADQGVFPATVINMVRVGEEAGALPTTLRSLSELYSETGRTRMKRFLTLLEPMAIIGIGGVIGLIVAAIMLAITSINRVAL